MATDYLIGNVKGPKGDTGATGTAATIQVGTVSTLTPGSNATVSNAGTSSAAVFNFGIPQGAKGDKGNKGDTGAGVPTGGTTGQVLKKKSGTNYDTEWGTDSAGHTILNSSGTAMTQRGKLQFVGATVTDNSANDKTIITTTPQSMIGDAWVTSHAYAVRDYCIDGNVLYKCKTAHTSSASYRPPYASYWDAVTVTSELSTHQAEHILYDSGIKTSADWTNDTTYNRYIISSAQSSTNVNAVKNAADTYGRDSIFIIISMETGVAVTNVMLPAYVPKTVSVSGKFDQIQGICTISVDCVGYINFPLASGNSETLYLILSGAGRSTVINYKWRFKIIAIS